MPYSHWGEGVYDFHDSGMPGAYWFMVLEISGRYNFKKAILDHKILAEKQAQKLLPADVYPLRVYHSRGMATARITKQ